MPHIYRVSVSGVLFSVGGVCVCVLIFLRYIGDGSLVPLIAAGLLGRDRSGENC